MTSTPELSSPSSCSSSEDGSPFLSALPISAFSPLQIPTCVSPEPSEITISTDAFDHENLPSPYTLHPVYPVPSKPTSFIPDTCLKQATSIYGAQSNTPDLELAPSAKPRKNLRQHRPGRSDSLPQTMDREPHRPNHPPFVKFSESLPVSNINT